MIQKLAPRFAVLVFVFVATLMFLVSPAALAQVTSTGQAPGESSVASLQGNKAAPAASDSGSLLFVPAVVYATGGPMASSTAVADLNGDGKPDLVVPLFDAVAVLLGKGDGSFLPAVAYPLQGGPHSLVISDVNGDKKPDLLVSINAWAPRGGNYVCILLGNGDGTFRAAVFYSSEGSSARGIPMAVADVNGDGKADLVVGNYYDNLPGMGAKSSLMVLLGNGDGTFQRGIGYGYGGVDPGTVAVADLNGDGKPELVVASCARDINGWCSGRGLIGALVGNGDGTFQAVHTYSAGNSEWGPSPVVVADVNGDGRPDLLVANTGGHGGNLEGSAQVLLGNGDGTFQEAATYDSGGLCASSIAAADINADGVPDLVMAHCQGSIGVLLGNGNGTFEPAQTYAAGSAYSVLVTDVNGDGKPDVMMAVTRCDNLDCGLGSVDVLLGNGDGSFQAAQTYFSSGLRVSGPAVADVNGDGKPDLLVTNWCSSRASDDCYSLKGTGSVGVLLNNGGSPATTITLVSSANPILIYKPVTYTATVTFQPGESATGTVSFLDGFSLIGKIPLDSNQATLSLPYRSISSHPIRAAYSGDLNNALGSISSTLTQNVGGTSTTAVTTSGSPSLIGQPVTITAKVSSYWGTVPDRELVTFADGTTPLGSAALVGGVASYTTSSLTQKTHVIKAVYGGDTRFLPSSGIVSHVITGYTTSAALASSLNPSIYGQSITWIAKVTTRGPSPTGNVAFRWSNSGRTFTIGTAPLNASGVATLTRSNLNADSLGVPYPIVAVYSGDASNLGSTSGVLVQDVLQTKSVAAITSSLNPSSHGQPVTFTASITSPTVTPTGPVTFTAGNTVLGTAQLSGRTARFTTSAMPLGSTSVKVTYFGNSNIAKSSASLTQIVH